MSTNFKRALGNYLRRSWWVWGLVVLFHLVAIGPLIARQEAGVLAGLIFIPSWTSNQFVIGWLRTLSTLPLSRKEVGHLRWWAIVGVPGVVLSAATVLLLAIAAPFAEALPSLSSVLTLLARVWGALGLLLLLPELARAMNGSNKVRGAFALLAFMIVLIGGYLMLIAGTGTLELFAPINYLPQLTALASGLGIVVGVIYFLRADRHVLVRPIARPADRGYSYRASRIELSGWFAVIGQLMPVVGIWTVLFALVCVLISVAVPMREPPYPIPLIWVLPFLGAAQLLIWIPAARALRVLPLSPGKLTVALMLIASLPQILVAVLLYGVGSYPLTWIPALVFLFCISTAALPFSLRFGHRPFVTVLAILPVVVGVVLAIMTQDVPILSFSAILLGLGVAIVVATYIWTRYELMNGVHAYRQRPPLVHSSFGGGMLPQ